MATRRFTQWLVLIVVSAGLLTGCDGPVNPAGPTGLTAAAGSTQSAAPSGNKRIGETSLVASTEIQGPSSIEPGQSAQFNMIERRVDGTTRIVDRAIWTSSDPSLVQVEATGLATAQSRSGEIMLSARTKTSVSKEVLVLPANTFRLIGTVRDIDGAAITNALVEVTGGPSATTDFKGAYRLYGVAPDAEIRITANGFNPVEQHLALITHSSINFGLTPDWLEGRNLAGDYRVTLEAVSSCSSLPSALRVRSYDATVTQNGTNLSVVLTQPQFETWTDNPGRFTGKVTANGATFLFAYGTWSADVVETLPGGEEMLEIWGSANTTESSGVLSGGMTGTMAYWDWWGNFYMSCSASQLTLTRK